MSKKVLLTGGTGLIGTQTIPFLVKAKYEVFVLTTGEKTHTTDVTYVKGDLFNKNEIEKIIAQIKPTHLLHYAWLSTGFFEDNLNFDFLTASINLLKSFAQNGGDRVIMAGTFAEYGFREGLLDESMSAQPINIYSKCKDFLHQISKCYCEKNGISFGWGRIFSAFGKETDPRRLTSDVLNHLNANEEVIIKSGSLIRDYIYVKDIAEAFVKFLDSDIEDTVNICTGKGTTIHDYVLEIAKILGKENLIVFKEQESNQQQKVIGSSKRLNNELKFFPKYSFLEALQEIIYENDYNNLKNN